MPIKVVSVDNVIRNNHFYYFRKFMLLQQKNVIDHVNVCFMFNVISIKDLEDVTTILLPIVLISVKRALCILKIYTNYELAVLRTNFLKLKYLKLLSNS